MKKIFILFVVLSGVIFLSGCAKQKTTQIQSNQPPGANNHVYKKHYDGSNSNIFIDCQEDNDCLLIGLNGDCCGFSSINKNSSEKEIEKFNKKQDELYERYQSDCCSPRKIEDHVAVCKSRICDSQKK